MGTMEIDIMPPQELVEAGVSQAIDIGQLDRLLEEYHNQGKTIEDVRARLVLELL